MRVQRRIDNIYPQRKAQIAWRNQMNNQEKYPKNKIHSMYCGGNWNLTMEKLGDDLLSLILSRIHDSTYRKSISQVCKQWFTIEGLNRTSLRAFEPNLIFNLLPTFPNLLQFVSSEQITNTHLQILAENCPRI